MRTPLHRKWYHCMHRVGVGGEKNGICKNPVFNHGAAKLGFCGGVKNGQKRGRYLVLYKSAGFCDDGNSACEGVSRLAQKCKIGHF